MSVEEVSPIKSLNARPSLLMVPRVSLFLSERMSSNGDNVSTEISTPLLPKNPWSKSKFGLSAKKSKFSDCPDNQENEGSDRIILLEIGTPLLALETSKPFELLSPLGSSSCGDESPFQRNCRRSSPRRMKEDRFDGDFYKRIEDFLDLEHLFICQPEDNRRSMFAHLRVSTARIKSLQDGNHHSGAVSENNSPALISPSIQTSTLFKRRSSSREMSADRVPKQKVALSKSPFYNVIKIGTEDSQQKMSGSPNTFNLDLDDVEESPRKKASTRIAGLGTKLQVLTMLGNKSRSDVVKMIDMDEEDANSPTKI